MDWLKLLRKDKPEPETVERKSYGTSPYPWGGGFLGSDNSQASSELFISYYKRVMPLSNAIDLIAEAFAAIPLKVLDTKTKEFVDHPVLDLLAKPNADITQKEFLRSFAKFFMITGNNFQLATGNINRPPLELMILPAQSISVSQGNDGFADVYTYSQGVNGSATFKRDEVDGRFRYFDGNDREIYHSKDFNPDCSDSRLWGLSKLQSIKIELDQYFNASVHNDSLLLNQARPSGALSTDADLSQDQIANLREEMDFMFSGPRNTGRPMLLDNGLAFSQFSQNMKDMDFVKMKEMVTEAIYNRLRIPLAMVQSSGLSLANMEHSPLTFYDNAVFPLADFIHTELTDFLMRRYPNSEDMVITFDPIDISAIETRRIKNVQILSGLNIMTDNEKRMMIGLEAIDGGDVISNPSAPQSEGFANNFDDKPDDFVESMKKQHYSDGTRVFSDDRIKEMAEKNGI